MNCLKRHLFAYVAITATVVAAAIAIAPRSAPASVDRKRTVDAAAKAVYRGKDSRGEPVTLAVYSGRRVAFSISFVAAGYSPSGQPDGSSCSSLAFFGAGVGVRTDQQGRFSHEIIFRHQSFMDEYFNGGDRISGWIQGRNASGTFSSIRKYYRSDGTFLGPCKTGLLRWTAQQA